MDGVLDIVPEHATADDALAAWVESQLTARAEARSRRDFGAADEIRRSLDQRGIIIEDTPAGTRWKAAR